ncbi:MAG: permease [Rhizobiales bacterium]|nr:permease [Hyphomicrobiales bacterium]
MAFTDVSRLPSDLVRRFDRVWIAVAVILATLAVFDQAQLTPTIRFALDALLRTAPYLLFAVLAIGYLKAAGAEGVIARAFEGRETRMIVAAALLGGLAPFCSCQVIPFIAGLLAVGTPLSAVMAFWLSSPLIDPPTLLITAAELGWSFAIAKAIAAVAMGLFGGFAMQAMLRGGLFAGNIANNVKRGCCSRSPFKGAPVWSFWAEEPRRQVFRDEALANFLFLLKWLTVAYVLESLMLRYVPAEAIAGVVGGDGLLPIVLSAFVGAPAYLNGYAAPALVSGLVEQGMSQGAAMAFIVAGAVTSIPAMTAVFALVRRDVFIAYLVLGFTGAVLSGVAYASYAALAAG